MTLAIVELSAVVLLGLGLAGVLILFLSLRRDLRAHVLRQRAHWTEMRAQLQEEIQRPMLQHQALGQAPPSSAARASVPAAFNFNRRIQAHRLLRRGADAAHISTALRIPRCEADLLIRIYRLTSQIAPQRLEFSS